MKIVLSGNSWVARVILCALIIGLLLVSRIELATFTYQGF